uniref:hypothetical protein n=1 Tax=Streptomyces chartreusis TaxID=1969 RepID=UPI003F497C75
MIDELTSESVEFHVEHYMIAVAEHLLAAGAAVSGVYSRGPYAEAGDAFLDTEGAVCLTQRSSEQLDGCASTGLHWAGTSGWYLGPDDPGAPDENMRWMGDGLVPEPGRVVAFLDTYRLAPERAGSRERPYYRGAGTDFNALLERLSAYVPPRTSGQYLARWRFSSARDTAYVRRLLDALTPQGTDPVVDVSLHASELDALLQLLEYVQVAAGGLGPSDFARYLARDIEGRRSGGRDAVMLHRSALDETAVWLRRIQEYQRQKDSGDVED